MCFCFQEENDEEEKQCFVGDEMIKIEIYGWVNVGFLLQIISHICVLFYGGKDQLYGCNKNLKLEIKACFL